MKTIALILLFLFLSFNPSLADTIVLIDGDSYQGEIVFEGEEKVHLKMEIGMIKFKRSEIATIRKSTQPGFESFEEEALPFPTKQKNEKQRRLAPRKRPDKYKKKVKQSISTIETPVLQKQKQDLDFREKELDLKKRELELRRRELELKKQEATLEETKAEAPVKPPAEKTEPITEPTLQPKSKAKPDPKSKKAVKPVESDPTPEVADEEEESYKNKGYTITPQIKGSGRYRTF